MTFFTEPSLMSKQWELHAGSTLGVVYYRQKQTEAVFWQDLEYMSELLARST